MAALNGLWLYKSYCPRSASATPPIPPQLAAPWAPEGELKVTTTPSGQILGTLHFGSIGITLTVKGEVTPAMGDIPEGVELTGTVGTSVYRLRGFFIAYDYAVVGTVLVTEDDLAKRPIGTQGPFILLPPRVIDQHRQLPVPQKY